MGLKPVIGGGSGFVQVPDGTGGGVSTVNGVSGAVTLLPPDTGWAASQGVGDKTLALQDYTNPGFAGADTINILALDALSDQVVALTKKVEALQHSLANNVRPNA